MGLKQRLLSTVIAATFAETPSLPGWDFRFAENAHTVAATSQQMTIFVMTAAKVIIQMTWRAKYWKQNILRMSPRDREEMDEMRLCHRVRIVCDRCHTARGDYAVPKGKPLTDTLKREGWIVKPLDICPQCRQEIVERDLTNPQDVV